MKACIGVLCLVAVGAGMQAHANDWPPSSGHTQVPIWPGRPPDSAPMPGAETVTMGDHPKAGKLVTWVSNVSRPTMTVYAPKGRSTGAAVVVFPGGGFQGLAIDLEGTEVCHWLTSIGITCVLLKYRVPSAPYDWHCDCRPDNLVESRPALEDAQQTLRLVRLHAAQWHVDPQKIGVIGFSAGGYLAAEASTDFGQRLYEPVGAVAQESDRPDFAMLIYPGHLATGRETLNPNVWVSRETPPTFLVQAEDDDVDGVRQSLVYFTALAKARVPAELHIYPSGGHGFGLRATILPITHWPKLAEAWLRRIGVIGR